VKPLADYVLGPDFERNLNTRNPLGSHGQVAREFRGVVRELRNSRGTVQPTGFKRALGMHSRTFADGGQHDAHECLVTILDGIHEDLNQSPRALGERIDKSRLSGMALHEATNKSEVSRLFHGVSQTRIHFKCGGSEVLEEPLVF
jgi:ubiquitin C-terminal hydrolase